MNTESSLEQLVEAAKQGDPDALAKLRKRCEPRARGLIDAELPEEFRDPDLAPSPAADVLLDVECSLPDEIGAFSWQAKDDLDQQFDASLIALVRQRVFLWLARRCESEVMARIRRAMSDYLRGLDLAGEIWNDTLRTAWQEYDDFCWQGEDAFIGWLREIAKGKIRDREKYEKRQRRDHRRRVGTPPTQDDSSSDAAVIDRHWVDDHTPGSSVRRRERAEILRATIPEVLSPKEQRAVELCYFGFHTPQEAAFKMQTTPGNVATICDRARKKLRRALRCRGIVLSSR